ncbi:MAG: VOC family protein [Myxococcota bacterium]
MLRDAKRVDLDRLIALGGSPEQCGWLKDRFGVSWQIVPSVMDEMMRDTNQSRMQRVVEAMLKMVKLDIEKLQAAYVQR